MSGRTGPLSFGQERLWRAHQLDPTSVADHLVLPLRFPGRVDAAALATALAGLVARHEMLRQQYRTGPAGEPRHEPVAGFQIPVTWEQVEDDGWQPAAEKVVGAPFDLAAAPPIRVVVVRCGGGSDVLVMAVHHIASDGRSQQVLARDLRELYRAARAGRPAALPPLDNASYLELVRERRDRWDRGSESGLDEFWRRYLDGAAPLELPLDRPRPRVPTPAGGVVDVSFPVELTAGLRALALRQRTLVAGVVMAAFQVVLGRYAGQREVTVGAVAHGRAGGAWRHVVGFFATPVPVRVAWGPGTTFREVVHATGTAMRDVLQRPDVPLDQVAAAAGRPASGPRHPLYDVVCVHHGELVEDEPPGPEAITQLPWARPQVRFDLELVTLVRSGRLTGKLCYRSDLFARRTAQRIATGFARVLAAAVDAPDQPVESLPLVPDGDRVELLTIGTGPAVPSAPATVPELFARQVALTPDALAATDGTTNWTYAELAAQVYRLARYLADLGVATEEVVAVCLPRSVGRVVALLAVLCAGGVYLPLDPNDPPARLRHLLDDAGVRWLLTDGRAGAALPTDDRLIRVGLDLPEVAAELAGRPAAPLSDSDRRRPLLPGHPAYLIYTSGSTGSPKAVVVPHTGLHRLAAVQAGQLQLGPGGRVLQYFPPSFDGSVWDTVAPLLTGAAVVVVPADELVPGVSLSTTATDHGVTHLTVTPTALAAVPAGSLPTVRTLVVAGESCPAELVGRWAAGREMWNAYGPTEGTVCATMAGPLADDGTGPAIGRPLPGTRVYLLDAAGGLVPAGATGELHLAGSGLAVGYRGRPGLTAATFTPCPFGDPGERMYRTGDLARWRPDGQLEFLGRRDDQVKVRGFRVELGEIESVLADHPSVDRVAAVVADGDGQARLVAYLTGSGPVGPDPDQVSRYAAARLPNYLLPDTLVPVDRLPLSPSGKVNRAALARRAVSPPETLAAPPTGEAARAVPTVETTVAQLCATVLGRAQVGLADDFFALGGNSLAALRLINQVRSELGRELSMRTVFEARTVAELAQAVRAAPAGS